MPCYIYPELDAVFVRVPKTGSSSIKQQFLGKTLPEHRIFGPVPNEYKHYKSFAFVRHPLDRFASAMAMFKERGREYLDREVREFAKSICTDTVLGLLADDQIQPGKSNFFEMLKLHTIPMTHPHFGLDRVDRIFRFENFEEEWGRLAAFLDVPVPPWAHVGGSGVSLLDSLSMAECERIHTYFIQDFETFGYK